MTPAEPAVQLPRTAPAPAAAEDDGILSPELVMVDPELRDRLELLPPPARWLPPEPEPEPERAPAEAEAPPPPLPLRLAEPPPPPPEPEPLPAARRRRRRWPLLLVALVVLAAAGAAVAVVALRSNDTANPAAAPPARVRTTGIGQPASSTPVTTTAAAPPAATTTPPAPTTTATARRTTTQRAHATPPVATHTTPAQTTKPKPHKQASPPPASTIKPVAGPVTHQKLAWAPAAGAAAYDLELLRGTRTVYVARTTQPSIVIAVGKGSHRPAGSVSAGTYEWVVWPVVGGHRSAQAIVRSQLHLTG
jgi:hypothetical protein